MTLFGFFKKINSAYAGLKKAVVWMDRFEKFVSAAEFALDIRGRLPREE